MMVGGAEVTLLHHQLDITGDGVEGGSDLMGHHCGYLAQGCQFFGLTQLPLGLEEGLVEELQFFVSSRQFGGSGFNLSGQLFIKPVDLREELEVLLVALPDRFDHTVEMSSQFPPFIPAQSVDFNFQVAFLRSGHGLHQSLNRISHKPPEEEGQHEEDDEDAGEGQDDRPVSLPAQVTMHFVQGTQETNSSDYLEPNMEGDNDLQSVLPFHLPQGGEIF